MFLFQIQHKDLRATVLLPGFVETEPKRFQKRRPKSPASVDLGGLTYGRLHLHKAKL